MTTEAALVMPTNKVNIVKYHLRPTASTRGYRTAVEAALSPHLMSCPEAKAEFEVFGKMSTRSALAVWISSADNAQAKNCRTISTDG
jgi:hypothetical protein